jgi:ribosomal protein L7Ae-like RNA K-turn-binding protein
VTDSRLRPFAVFGFESVHDTLEAEDVLRAAGIPAITIPSPKELGELCGIALRVEPEFTDGVEAALAAARLAGARVRTRARVTILDR